MLFSCERTFNGAEQGPVGAAQIFVLERLFLNCIDEEESFQGRQTDLV